MSSHWFKQCPVYQDILKSNCSKGKCILDGKKPRMVLPVAATACMYKKKLVRDETSDSDNDESESFDESDFECGLLCVFGGSSSCTYFSFY